MSTNKNAILRYQTLDKCFRNLGKRYFINDLIEECNEALFDYDSSNLGIQKRQEYEMPYKNIFNVLRFNY